jgi:hypothetical protein
MPKSTDVLLALSPAQRFQIYQLTRDEKFKIPNGQEGRRYRLFLREFGVAPVAQVARTQGAVLAAATVDEDNLALHEVSQPALEYALEFLAREKPAVAEEILGELLDLLEDIKAKRPYDAPALPPFDHKADTDRWLPQLARQKGRLLTAVPAAPEIPPAPDVAPAPAAS